MSASLASRAARAAGGVLLGGAAVAVVALALLVVATAHRCARPFPPDAVLVPLGEVPPDACLAVYGPGPCREYGPTVQNSTDAVALWRPELAGGPLRPVSRREAR